MKYSNSILLCQFDTGKIDLYINGVEVMLGEKTTRPISRIANCSLTNKDIIGILNEVAGKLNNLDYQI